ncbi:MAG TPA: glutamate synthase large subunit, partial [Gammaproteobacteria bacterium]|nr:glutamate synthase large subunit [Gammaproteobacteria bacterium]
MSDHSRYGLPPAQGLYRPEFEHDSCGVGFVAHIKGERSHQILTDADHLLCRMDHRGARGAEANTGDGAGILTALPREFLAKVFKRELGVELPPAGAFAAGNVFLPTDAAERERCKAAVARICAEEGQKLLGWRLVPTRPDEADVGDGARAAMPQIEQLFIAAGSGVERAAFERKLYLIRKRSSHELRGDKTLRQAKLFYICSLSTTTLIYKGMLTPGQLKNFYPDLDDPDYKTHLAMVHSRFSTNTFPSWDRAQPNRYMSHNGEINTIRGNENWMRARQGVVQSELYGESLKKLFPIVEPDCSDSGVFDNVLEFLVQTGRTLQESVMMMIPEAWQKNELMPASKRAFYEYHSCLMEPWDGPASIAFTDGKYIGAVLDRNGLRPSRYYLTHDDRVIMASEVGVVPINPTNVKAKGRLEPGRMFLIDFERGRLVPDEELKNEFASRRPYGEWLDANRIALRGVTAASGPARFDRDTLLPRLQAFGYTIETMHFMLQPMVREHRDPVGSMGNDSTLAVLSDKPRMLYDYFRQLFAQVTNPPIDSIREEVIMSLECYVGPERNLLETTPKHAERLRLRQPILSNEELAGIKNMNHRGWRSRTIDITFARGDTPGALQRAIDRICKEAEQAIDDGCSLVVLSDRAIGPDRVPVSSLLACGAVHHHLLSRAKRTRIGIVLETGEAREVHHHCLLVGYGADGINPYLAFEALSQSRDEGQLDADIDIVGDYRQAVAKGMLKVMAKMGISTVQSYKGAQIFEAVGLADEVIDRCFGGTVSRLQGVSFAVLEQETLRRHALGFPLDPEDKIAWLPNPGEFHWRSTGERHAWDPQAIFSLQVAARRGDAGAYKIFAEHVNKEARELGQLRGLLDFKPAGKPISIDEVEPASEIVKRFCTGAMSFGSLSAEAHETLAIAMNRIGGKSNTGEGGEDSARYVPLPSGDSRRSAIKQIASGRFGVTIWYLANADELQIKMAQGAKPGEGGELPGKKVDDKIARIRHSTPGVGLISPPPHHDIYSIEDLAQLIHDLKNSNPSARISVKLVSEVGVGTVAAGVAKAHSDVVLISGDSGGTGASPVTSIKHAGIPWELGLAETHQTLVLNNLRGRIIVQTDGQLKTGRDVIVAAL